MRWTSLLFLILPLLVVAAKKDLPVSLVVDDAPVAQVLQTLAEMLDAGMLVYLEVSLQNTTSEILNEFNAAVQQLPPLKNSTLGPSSGAFW